MQNVIFRSWPKLIFAWPTALGAITVAFVVQSDPTLNRQASLAFLVLFALNLMVLGFEFSRWLSLTLFFAVVALIVSGLWLNETEPFIHMIRSWILKQKIGASPPFYFALGFSYLIMFVLMFLKTRFDYWILSPNELIHQRGMLGKNERFSTNGMRLSKEIPDVVEYLFGGAGTLVIELPGRRPVVIENVMGIRRIEEAADKILDANVVRVESPIISGQSFTMSGNEM